MNHTAVDATWKCWNCRHDRKGCKRSSEPSTCDWCIKNKYQCTEDAPSMTRKRKAARFRCQQCRTRKQKCLPEDRQWPEKCNECKRHNLDCSEPQLPKRARPKEQHIPLAPTPHNNDNTTTGSAFEGLAIEELALTALPVLRAAEKGLATGRHTELSALRKALLECSRRLGRSYGLFKAVCVTPGDDILEYIDCDMEFDWLFDRYTLELDFAEKLSSKLVANDFPLELQKLYSNMVQGYEVILQCRVSHLFTYEEEDNDEEFHERMLHKRFTSSMTRLASAYTTTDEFEAAIQVYEKAVDHISRSSGDFLTSLLDDTVKDLIALYKRQQLALREHLHGRGHSSRPAAPLHRAAATGIAKLVSAVLDGDEVDVDDWDFFSRTALHFAAKAGLPEVLEIILKRQADPNYADDAAWTAAMRACSSGSLKCVEILYDSGADTNAGTNFGESAIFMAARNGHFEIVKMLLRVTEQKIDDTTEALKGAVSGGHCALTRMLLDDGADANASDHYSQYRTPLHHASKLGHEAIVRLLLDRNAKIDTVGHYGTALHISCDYGYISVARVLLQRGADVNASPGIYGRTALISASEAGRQDLVKLLLDHGADVNAIGRHDHATSLQLACKSGHEGIVRLLLKYDTDVNATGPMGSALYIACKRNLGVVAKLLVEAGADVDLRHNCETPLERACELGHEGIVKLLLGQQADVNAKNSADVTALHIASLNGHESIVWSLLLFGANANASDEDLKTPLHNACRNNFDAVVRLLLLGGANANMVGAQGTPLHIASAGGFKSIAELLLQAGAEVNKVGPSGTALACAYQKGHRDIVSLLLKYGATDITVNA